MMQLNLRSFVQRVDDTPRRVNGDEIKGFYKEKRRVGDPDCVSIEDISKYVRGDS